MRSDKIDGFRCVRGIGLVSVWFLTFPSSYHDGQPEERSNTLRMHMWLHTYIHTYICTILTKTTHAHTYIHRYTYIQTDIHTHNDTDVRPKPVFFAVSLVKSLFCFPSRSVTGNPLGITVHQLPFVVWRRWILKHNLLAAGLGRLCKTNQSRLDSIPSQPKPTHTYIQTKQQINVHTDVHTYVHTYIHL